MPKELAHIRALSLCLLKFVYTSGFGKIYCFELCNINLTGHAHLRPYLSVMTMQEVFLVSPTIRWTGNVINGPYLTAECDDVCGVPDDFK